MKLQASLDDTVIYYTKREPYVTTLYQLAEKHHIPVTFGEGLPILYSQPGRLVSTFIKWLKEDYSVPTFIELMNEGLMELPEEAPSKSKISTYLRKAKVGWSQSRYSSQLKRLKDEVQQKLKVIRDEKLQDYYQNQINEISWLESWFKRLFKGLPALDVELNYQKVLKGISTLLEKYATTSSILDELAKTELQEQIDVILPYADEMLNQFEVLEKIKDLLLITNVNQSGPKPGHLHMASYKSGLYNNRNNVFLVGLDNHSSPGTTNDDSQCFYGASNEVNDSLCCLMYI